ncbi:integral membrane protein DGCR2/IDD-like [Asterias amurensis]|uniref:integral membrane protein DGCR2/IDD-like n=1 Tax=Asterias amurensis TaxID=7602 RepID=UPI003AB79AE8
MDSLVHRFLVCFFLQVVLLLRINAVPGRSNNSTPIHHEPNSWDVPHSSAVCKEGWHMYQPTFSCFKSFGSVFVQQSALDFCTTAESHLATVTEPELDYLAALSWVGQESSQTWWMGYEMRQVGDNSTEWQLVDVADKGGDLGWIGLKTPTVETDEIKLCVLLALEADTKQSAWHLQSCTEKSTFLCKQDAHKVCLDRSGNEIWEGEKYIPPGSDSCTSCRCVAGKPEMCLTSMCQQPPCENYQPDPDKCCEYICKDGGDADDKPKSDMSDTMRWVLTMLTSFILLGMMLFMVYRMRQKRIAYLRYRAQQMREGSMMDFEPGSGPPPIPNMDDFDGAVFREPPPPYSFLKDERHIPVEQPPPYISTVGLQMDINRNRDRRSSFLQNSDAMALLEGSVSSEPNTPTLVTGVPVILPSPPAYTSSTENSNVSSPQTEQSTPGGESSVVTTPSHHMILPSINTTV